MEPEANPTLRVPEGLGYVSSSLALLAIACRNKESVASLAHSNTALGIFVTRLLFLKHPEQAQKEKEEGDSRKAPLQARPSPAPV
jgi:hypothetical protein